MYARRMAQIVISLTWSTTVFDCMLCEVIQVWFSLLKARAVVLQGCGGMPPSCGSSLNLSFYGISFVVGKAGEQKGKTHWTPQASHLWNQILQKQRHFVRSGMWAQDQGTLNIQSSCDMQHENQWSSICWPQCHLHGKGNRKDKSMT